MFAANEWLIALVSVALVALLVWLILRGGRGIGASGLSSARVRGEPAGVLNDLQLSLSTVRGTVCRRDPSSLTVEWTYIPGWAVVLAILLFPIGLVALVARTTASGTVVAEGTGDHEVTMRIGGVFNRGSVGAINAVIESRS